MKMNLWVRNQDKTILQKVDNLLISDGYNAGGTFNIYTNSLPAQNVLGRYKTKERAIEILDEIQSLLQPTIEYKPIVQEEYNPSYTYKHFVKVDDNIEIKELSTFVYQMPAE